VSIKKKVVTFLEKKQICDQISFFNFQAKLHAKKVDPYNGNEELDRGKV
jgi:hypothetical protein